MCVQHVACFFSGPEEKRNMCVQHVAFFTWGGCVFSSRLLFLFLGAQHMGTVVWRLYVVFVLGGFFCFVWLGLYVVCFFHCAPLFLWASIVKPFFPSVCSLFFLLLMIIALYLQVCWGCFFPPVLSNSFTVCVCVCLPPHPPPHSPLFTLSSFLALLTYLHLIPALFFNRKVQQF